MDHPILFRGLPRAFLRTKSKEDGMIRRIFSRGFVCALFALMFVPMVAVSAHAQGCILARSPEQAGLPTEQGGLLQPHQFQLTIGERHQFSYQHYVGDVYQEYRAQDRTQVENRINLVTLNLTYQVTPRVSVEWDMPWLFASRKQQSSPIKYNSSGAGDTIVAVNSWLWNPNHVTRGNVELGLGLYMPTGNDDVTNTIDTNTSGTGPAQTETVPVDYSIQPGTGGWGGVFQWVGYHTVGNNFVLYTDGDYIAMQGGTNGISRGFFQNPKTPMENTVAIADQYLWEGGVEFPIPEVKGLAMTAGARWEGVPAYNLLPVSNDGFRRPGYAVSVGPGLEYSWHKTILTANIYDAVHRDRTRSYPDHVYGGHGDAAFAQYLWLASYTYRF